MKRIALAPLALCLLAGPALADTPIQLRHAAAADARIAISNVAGSVVISGWDQPAVEVTGQLGDGSKPLAITGTDGKLEIKVEAEGSGGWFNFGSNSRMKPTSLVVHVPNGASLEIDTVSANVRVSAMDGGKIEADTVSGEVEVDVRTPDLDVETVSGNIRQSGHAGKAELQTVSGEIQATALGSRADLETISGDIRASGGPWQELSMSTVSGDAELRGGPTADGSIVIDSMSGNIDLYLPADTSARLRASCFSGNIQSDFGQVKEPEHGPGSNLEVQLGSGPARIKAETFSGNVRIRKLP